MTDVQQLQSVCTAAARALPGPWEQPNLVRLLTAGLASLAQKGDLDAKAVVDLIASGQVEHDAAFIGGARNSVEALARVLEQHQRMAKALHWYVDAEVNALEADCGQIARSGMQDVEIVPDPAPPVVLPPKDKMS